MAIIKSIGKKFCGMSIKVDDEDFDFLNSFRWYVHESRNTFYASMAVYNPETKKNDWFIMHRIIMRTPNNMVCDHKNHDGLDNRKNNLRNCTAAGNAINTVSRKNSTSKYRGVSVRNIKMKNGYRKVYVAQIQRDRKAVFLGRFNHTKQGEIDAAKAFNKAAKIMHGEFAHLNVINKK